MPFTLGGEWVPAEDESPEQSKISSRPVKVRKEKRGRTWVTVILNLNQKPESLKSLAADLKKSCGCGGTVKNGVIEIQGERCDEVRSKLKERGIKAQ